MSNTQVCFACISVDRPLLPVNLRHESITKWLQLPEKEHLACWECRELLRKFDVFVKKIINAQTIFRREFDKSALKSQSTLAITHKSDYDYIYFESKKEIEPSTSYHTVKIECVDENVKIEDIEETTEECLDFDADFSAEEHKYILDAKEVKSEGEEEIKSDNLEEDNKDNEQATIAAVNKVILVDDRVQTIRISHEEVISALEKIRQDFYYKKLKFKCETCAVGFSSLDQWKKHGLKHTARFGPCMCPICECRFADEESMKIHNNGHYLSYRCAADDCNYTHVRKSYVTNHYKRQHVPKNDYTCTICRKEFPTRNKLRSHRQLVHVRLPCEECGKSFGNSSALKTHMLIHKGLPVFKCDTCQRNFRGAGTFQTHVKTHAEKPEDAYCVTCNKQYKNISVYRTHLKRSLVHNNVNNMDNSLQCDYCGAKFTTKPSLKLHILAIHMKKYDHVCHICDKLYMTGALLRKHIKHYHEKIPKKRNFNCEICSKAFIYMKHLQDHMNTHTGNRPYKCKECPSTFSSHGALYTHVKLVHLKLRRGDKSIKISTL